LYCCVGTSRPVSSRGAVDVILCIVRQTDRTDHGAYTLRRVVASKSRRLQQ